MTLWDENALESQSRICIKVKMCVHCRYMGKFSMLKSKFCSVV